MSQSKAFPPDPQADCNLCPRLVEFREENKKKFPDFFNGAVGSFGPNDARLLIIGLAPGLKGANRTGRPFTGDYAGDLLYSCLEQAGLAKGTYDKRPDDGFELIDTMITNAVRCVPPQNKPIGEEVNNCRPFLNSRISALKNLKAYLALGKIAHDTAIRNFGLKLKDYPFGHAKVHELPDGKFLIDSYHCSRYNVNTNRITEAMFLDALNLCKEAVYPQIA
ncbi:uracil-DNA glycosylase [Kordiimonas sp. SCSIO 12610]|uniref:uracil-DNA glycosylase n=1 Tax=Kordiimonas sp. SCSIO 12610 TaxID=2829597 RepID=UPI00210B9308|nr:uracil-DNA glycosylase [Kordiimonas sp. SCSIO 12610]UTW56663.1 uracil-DNA glycosylase [Kordiimonas sp. SCSIO 12610]